MGSRNLLDEVIAMEVALEWEREMKRVMEESLWEDEMTLQERVQECSVLTAENERELADIEIKRKLIEEFMVFLAAVENNDLEKAGKFDEKAMMEAVVPMINGQGDYGGKRAGFGGVFGAQGNNELEIAHIPVEESMAVVVEAVGCAEAIEGTKTDGGECSNAGGTSGK